MASHRNPAYRRYIKRFIPVSLLYVAAIFLASYLIADNARATPLNVGIALLPGLAVAGMVWAMGRLLIELDDEYLRMLEVQKALIATGITLAATATWGILELYTDVPKVPLFFAFPLWCAGLGAAQIWQKVRGV